MIKFAAIILLSSFNIYAASFYRIVGLDRAKKMENFKQFEKHILPVVFPLALLHQPKSSLPPAWGLSHLEVSTMLYRALPFEDPMYFKWRVDLRALQIIEPRVRNAVLSPKLDAAPPLAEEEILQLYEFSRRFNKQPMAELLKLFDGLK